jgi:hypothetical protein
MESDFCHYSTAMPSVTLMIKLAFHHFNATFPSDTGHFQAFMAFFIHKHYLRTLANINRTHTIYNHSPALQNGSQPSTTKVQH